MLRRKYENGKVSVRRRQCRGIIKRERSDLTFSHVVPWQELVQVPHCVQWTSLEKDKNVLLLSVLTEKMSVITSSLPDMSILP